MPRLLIEHSSNLLEFFDPTELLQELLERIGKVDTVDINLTKARIDCPQIGYMGPWELREQTGYIFILFEWLEGRTHAQKEALWEALSEPMRKFRSQMPQCLQVSITVEVQSIPSNDHRVI